MYTANTKIRFTRREDAVTRRLTFSVARSHRFLTACETEFPSLAKAIQYCESIDEDLKYGRHKSPSSQTKLDNTTIVRDCAARAKAASARPAVQVNPWHQTIAHHPLTSGDEMNNPLIIVAIFCAGTGIGAGVCFAIMRTSAQSFAIRAQAEVKHREAVRREAMEELKTVRQQLKQKSDAYNSLRIQAEKINPTLVNERSASQEKIATIESAEKRMTHTFQALDSQSLRKNNDSFMQVAQGILKQHTQSASGDLDKRKHEITRIMQPIEQSLKQVQLHVTDLEKQRVSAYSGLQEQVRGLLESQKGLKDETSKLTHALRSPGFAGSWGQIQLRRVVELSGMVAHCDFTEQQTVGHGSNQQWPDMVIHLPGDTDIVVDAKASMTAYSEAVNSQDIAVQNESMKERAARTKPLPAIE